MLNKKIKKLLIGTNNKGKLKEIRDLLPKRIKTLSISAFKIKSPRENGKTFQENSLIKFCKRCLYSNMHPLGLTINDEGICSGCEIHEEKNGTDVSIEIFQEAKLLFPNYFAAEGTT